VAKNTDRLLDIIKFSNDLHYIESSWVVSDYFFKSALANIFNFNKYLIWNLYVHEYI